MSYETLSTVKSLVQLGTFFLAVGFLIPQSVKNWSLWKKTGKSAYLSGTVAAGVVAFFLLAANFVRFMKIALEF